MTKGKEFVFLDPGPLVEGNLQLVLVRRIPGNPEKELAPAYGFDMRITETTRKIGIISLRIGNIDKIIKYDGHIGYGVDPQFRGHRYAARSCKLLFPFARQHGINPLWITCNPDNMASRRTCEIAGGTLIEIVDLPEDNDQYQTGDRRKCRYRFDL